MLYRIRHAIYLRCFLFKMSCYKNPRGRGLPTPHPTLYSERVDSLLFFDGSFFIRVLCVSYWKSCWIFANEFIICCFLVKKHLFGISVQWKLARKTVPFHKNTPIGSSALLTSTLTSSVIPWNMSMRWYVPPQIIDNRHIHAEGGPDRYRTQFIVLIILYLIYTLYALWDAITLCANVLCQKKKIHSACGKKWKHIP